jgi:N-dimethylarginine dimethylaminohydrolase
MNEIILINLPKKNEKVKGCWSEGYPIHKGLTENSLNYATVFSNENKIYPDQKRLEKDYKNFVKTMKKAGFKINLINFPEELNQPRDLRHDGVFARDQGIMFKKYWIKSNFSCEHRKKETEILSPIIAKKFNKKIIELPKNAFLEGGEIKFIQTKKETYYFGGTARANKKGHEFIKKIIKPNNYCLIESEGYHLDTVFCPVTSKENELIAFIVAKNLVSKKSIQKLKKFEKEILFAEPVDSSGEGKELGTYAINGLAAPGILINSTKFLTPGIEEKLQELGIKRFITQLKDFRFAGGSVHCLTNEIFK